MLQEDFSANIWLITVYEVIQKSSARNTHSSVQSQR